MGTTIKKTTAKKAVAPKTGISKASAPKTTGVKSVASKPVRKTVLKAEGESPEPKKTTRTKLAAAQTVKKTASVRSSSPKTSPEKSEDAPQKKSVAKKASLAKPAVKKTTAAKAVSPKATVKKVSARKTAVLKAVSAETESEKPAVKKTAAKKAAVRKSASLSEKPLEVPLEPILIAVESKPKKAAVLKVTPARLSARKTAKTAKGTPDVATPPVSADNPQMEVESRKFDMGLEHETPYPVPPPGYGLPDFYDETYVRLLVRDPEWVFVYWEIDVKTRERFWIPRGAHAGRLILRWYDVTDVSEFNGQNAQRVIETAINDQTSSWYQHLPDPGRYWCAELGVLSSEGEFLCICRSNVVQTPRVTLASLRDYERWMRVGWLLEEREIFEAPAGQVPPEAQEAEGARRVRADKPSPAWQPAAPGEPESGSEETAARLAGQPWGGRSSESLISSFGFVSSSQVMRPDLAEQLETLKKNRKK